MVNKMVRRILCGISISIFHLGLIKSAKQTKDVCETFTVYTEGYIAKQNWRSD